MHSNLQKSTEYRNFTGNLSPKYQVDINLSYRRRILCYNKAVLRRNAQVL